MTVLYKMVDGAWYSEGTYSTPNSLANAAFLLGRQNAAEQVRTAGEPSQPDVALYVLINGKWLQHGTYQLSNLTPMVRAVHLLAGNPNVQDFKII